MFYNIHFIFVFNSFYVFCLFYLQMQNQKERFEEFQRQLFGSKFYFELNDSLNNPLAILKKKHDEWYRNYDQPIFAATRRDADSFNRFRKAPTDQVSEVVKKKIEEILSKMLDKKTQEQYYQLYLWYYIAIQRTDAPDIEDAVRKAKAKWLGDQDGELGEYEKNNLQVYGIEKECHYQHFGGENCKLTTFIEQNWEKCEYLDRLWG